MSDVSKTASSLPNCEIPPLDPTLYSLSGPELAFFKCQTGIYEEEALKSHILDIQAKAYEIQQYHYIHKFSFLKLIISRLPVYQKALNVLRRKENAILLDVGCGLGNDIRKSVNDGWPVHNVLAVDISQGIWDCGHELFNSTPSSFPVTFFAENIMDEKFFELKEPLYSSPHTPMPESLRDLKSLDPVRGHVSVIYASLLFHLFDEENQLLLAHRLASLLSPEPGSIIIGIHPVILQSNADETKTIRHESEDVNGWRGMWDGEVFQRGAVKVWAKVKETHKPDLAYSLLMWSVMRL